MMKLNEMLLAQIDREVDSTRKVVERVPEGKADWKPHPKSMAMGYLSALVASMFGWIAMEVSSDFLDLSSGSGARASTGAERLALFDKSVADAREALSNATDEHLMKPWQLRMGEKVLDEKPRYIVITDTISHLAHHRGQLSVYLRLNEQPVPSIYGPTADEGWQG
jgi:hypothetical protein